MNGNNLHIADFEPSDFRRIETFLVTEELSADELEEGLEAMDYLVSVCFSGHSNDRTENEEEREVSWDEMLPVFLEAGDQILSMGNGKDFAISSKEERIAIIGRSQYYNGELYLVLKTVIRVKNKKGGGYRKVHINNNTDIIVSI